MTWSLHCVICYFCAISQWCSFITPENIRKPTLKISEKQMFCDIVWGYKNKILGSKELKVP